MSKKIPDKKSNEKVISDLSRLLENKDFESEKDLIRFLGSIDINKNIQDMPPKNSAELAQDIMYDA